VTDDYPADDHYPVADAYPVTDAYPTDPESGETKRGESQSPKKKVKVDKELVVPPRTSGSVALPSRLRQVPSQQQANSASFYEIGER
jgi:hypothetical protein